MSNNIRECEECGKQLKKSEGKQNPNGTGIVCQECLKHINNASK